jgi:hypothetical protein
MRAFIIRPFGQKQDRQGATIDFDAVESTLIDPALERFDIAGRTTLDIAKAGNIREDMFRLLVTADLVIADISIHNANVFYELGIRHALRDRRTFMIRCNADAPVFDLQTDRYLEYDRQCPQKALPALIEALRQTLDAGTDDSPVFSLLPQLEALRPAAFLCVPQDFTEDVGRAEAERQLVDLALLCEEAKGFEWEQEGFRTVGHAQYRLGDHAGARVSWEEVRKIEATDLEANTILATVFHRLGDLTASEQAIRRALSVTALTPHDHAELHSLLGRNAKAQWLAEWRAVPEDVQPTAALQSGWLEQAREHYADGFQADLNHFYSGLNALAMLKTELALADALPAVWSERSIDPDEAPRDRAAKIKRADQLGQAVELSLNASKAKLDRAGEKDIWTTISEADLCCLTAEKPQAVAATYKRALADAPDFAIDAARSQLLLYRQLGMRPATVDAALAVFPPAPTTKKPAETTSDAAPPRVLVFTGHMIDAPGRKEARFPADREAVARQAIFDVVKTELAQPGGVKLGIAGGASGGDILFHEVCAELEIPTELFLALPRDQFLATSVTPAGSAWVERFRALYDRLPKHELSAGPELPAWLRGKKNYDIWQRNNLWMLYNALARGHERLTLIALWDGKSGDAPGGTEHMIETAKSHGAKPIVLDTKALFKFDHAP